MIFIIFGVIGGINIPSFVFTLIISGVVLLIEAYYGYSLKAQMYYDLREMFNRT